MRFLSILILSTLVFVSGQKIYSFEVQGHRGARGVFPENTLSGFASAIEAGVHTLELDLHITLDGKIVIHHDYFLQEGVWECENKDALSSKNLIRFLNLSEIKQFDCGSIPNPKFPRQQIVPKAEVPTLDELFTMIQNSTHPHAKNVRLNLEIKRDPGYPELSVGVEELTSKIISKVKEYGFSDRVCYSSFDPEVLMKVYQLDPLAELGFMFNQLSLAIAQKIYPENPIGLLIKTAQSFQAKVLFPHFELIKNKDFIQGFKQLGFRVVPWTVNLAEDWTTLINMGVDGIITDYPHDLLTMLE